MRLNIYLEGETMNVRLNIYLEGETTYVCEIACEYPHGIITAMKDLAYKNNINFSLKSKHQDIRLAKRGSKLYCD